MQGNLNSHSDAGAIFGHGSCSEEGNAAGSLRKESVRLISQGAGFFHSTSTPSVRKSPQKPDELRLNVRHARHEFPTTCFASSSGVGSGDVTDQPARLRTSCSDSAYKQTDIYFLHKCRQYICAVKAFIYVKIEKEK